ncbi:hypothetical protein L2E82_37369 [Cichorium intybus]|uniref:Uncharacterized protein n=1 Tax=Cichorium intybus TaxID=13427 RepID=A0ACB9AE47_CICIN|nr:hypothetical protein L2E82_37369 [Cichorium intybus]
MASLSISTLPTSTTTKKPFFSKTPSHVNKSRRFTVSCNAASDNNDKTVKNSDTPNLILPKTSLEMQNVDRRNLLLGLGGLYGATNLTTIPSAFGMPIAAPDIISHCASASSNLANTKDTIRGVACCPPVLSTDKPKDYVLPWNVKPRVRPAAQRASADYIEKYQKAIQAMRDLPDSHPHSWKQQGMIHCAYCNGGYTQEQSGHPDKQLQIHNSWLFFPFHRWYLYFYERILGKLINDPTFALPYWNWDNPSGMQLPAMFEDNGKKNPLFDPLRDAIHLPPAIFNVEYAGADTGDSCIKQIGINLSSMYRQMITNSCDTKRFFGGEFVAGNDPLTSEFNAPGTIEKGVHTAAHRWVGNRRMANGEDMGNFYSAGYDPLFYVHHANVDRMWKIWRDVDMKRHKDPDSSDWLNASYVFYDENENLVRVYNRDCVDIRRMGYVYERSEIPWIRSRPIARVKGANVAAKSLGVVQKVEDVVFPLKLNKTVKVLVKRPAINRTEEDKEKETEVLFLNGINFDGEKFLKFDVFVNDVDDGVQTTAADSEFAGSFAQLPHGHNMEMGTGEKMLMKSGSAYGITELLEDIEAEGDESVVVKLVPRIGCEEVTVGEIKIKLVPVPTV